MTTKQENEQVESTEFNNQDANETGYVDVTKEQEADEMSSAFQPRPIYPYFPIKFAKVSGLYTYNPSYFKLPKPYPITPYQPFVPGRRINEASYGYSMYNRYIKEEFRLDVDGYNSQMTASGNISSIFVGNTNPTSWVASLTSKGVRKWNGNIWYKNGGTFNYTNVEIEVMGGYWSTPTTAKVTFKGAGLAERVRIYKYKSPYFHSVEFEYDVEQGQGAIKSIHTKAHPNNPATITSENLSIKKVFQRAGFDVKKSGGDNTVLSSEAGANTTWSDAEMHDAMQSYWSKYDNNAQWSMWVLWARRHDQGSGLGGIMFDDIGPNERQGTAIFNDSFIKNAPAGDSDPTAWVNRMKFWTAVHEMGHAFNLAHAWQKAFSHPSYGDAWIPTPSEPESRSFMNYPYNVSGGESAFFADFEFRFSDSELLFMRHAPSRFVEMGNEDWFDNHGYEDGHGQLSSNDKYCFELRVHRNKNEFEFMERVDIEIKLANKSNEPVIVNGDILEEDNHAYIFIKRDGGKTRKLHSYKHYCKLDHKVVLLPDNALYATKFVSADSKGWKIDEPGYYTIQAIINVDGELVKSNELRIRINPPKSYDHAYLGQDYFNKDIARVLYFNGSMALNDANCILREVKEKLSSSNAAIDATVALATPQMKAYKMLSYDNVGKGKIKVNKPNTKEVYNEMIGLFKDMDLAVEKFGHINTHQLVDNFSNFMANDGNYKDAAQIQNTMHSAFKKRNVLPKVLSEINAVETEYKKKS
ncbi:MAG: hypothetical protein GY775_13455 [Candidatus Scalindua sp.]|nr:hypothetical protein [Candidatus Scalindua sp.]